MAKGKRVSGVYLVNGVKMTLTRKQVIRRLRRTGKDRQRVEHYRAGLKRPQKGILG